MILSISAIKKGTISYIILTILTFLFPIIYEQFSLGEYSYYMRYMFISPLLLGVLPFGIQLTLQKTYFKNPLHHQLWNSGVASIILGCIIKGIIEVSGRTTELEQPFWYFAIINFTLSISLSLYNNKAHN